MITLVMLQQPPEVSNPNQNIVNPNVPPVDSGRFSQHPARRW